MIKTLPRLAAILSASLMLAGAAAPPRYEVDPRWPHPLPQVMGVDGQLRRWVTGDVGGVCIDSHDHIVTMNRSWQRNATGGLQPFEALGGVAAPPFVVYDRQGQVAASFGDASFAGEKGPPKVLPEGFHGCFVDGDDNIWVAGSADGVLQKWSHDGSRLLLQIGTRGDCDGEPDQNPAATYPSCGESGARNASRTRLNMPADVWVDANPDPVTGKPGSVYVADGYGNHRIVVFDAEGRFLRQWGSAGDGPGQFARTGGGHPHCVAVSRDGTVYACDRGHNRYFEFDRLGNLKRTVQVDPEGGRVARLRTNDIDFSKDPEQRFIFTTDMGNAVVHIIERASGRIVGGVGVGPGRSAGQFVAPHQLALDSRGDLYVAETLGGRRIQKFVLKDR